MLSYNELKKGLKIILNGEPFEILQAAPSFKGRGHSVLQVKLKNLITGNVVSKTFHPSDTFKEANLEKINLKFIYPQRGQYIFSEADNPSKRIELKEQQIGSEAQFLKPNQIVEGSIFRDKVISISLPIKVQLKVKEAPPGIKAGRAEAGTKQVILETGAKINVPLFIKEGEIIEINTETGEYVRRVE